MDKINIYNEDCVEGSRKLRTNSVKLMICDPPFGIGESDFDKHYKRDVSKVIKGYKEVKGDYYEWTHKWISKAKRVLHPDGSFYIVIGNTNLRHVLNAASDLGLYERNHIIWKFNFGVYTRKKFVTSHYHILYYIQSKKANITFNTGCRFGSHEKDMNDHSKLYKDLEDVFVINKEYIRSKDKNQNKLPQELIDKLILYSSNKNDVVGDFFLGNFTSAYSALKLGRKICGFELNKKAYDHNMKKIQEIEFGHAIKYKRGPKDKTPINQGKPISEEEAMNICREYYEKTCLGRVSKKKVKEMLQEKYGRGRFSIKNIIDSNIEKCVRLYPEIGEIEQKKQC